MDNNELKKARLFIDKWRVELAKKDRKIKSVQSNFSELFHNMWKAGVTYDAILELLDLAVRAHLPDHSIAKSTYRQVNTEKTYQQFLESWQDDIRARAIIALTEVYGDPIVGAPQEIQLEKPEVEQHAITMRRLSTPLTAQRYKELLALKEQLKLENNDDEHVG